MIKATCIQKFKKNNKIYGYRLQDSQGNIKDVYADQLKQAIHNQQITVINLTFTSDNRLVDTTPTQPTQPKVQQPQISEEQKIKNLILKSKALGLPIKEIPTSCGHHCILISKSETQHIIYIPDDVVSLNGEFNLTFTNNIQKLQGTLKVTGGHNLKNAICMFNECQAQSLDLTSFNTSKVTNMRFMFTRCNVQSLDLSSFNTSRVTNMDYMFQNCKAQSLDLSSFNTSNVTDMDSMFINCKAQIKATDPKILEKYKRR